jgi:hypothetical protein
MDGQIAGARFRGKVVREIRADPCIWIFPINNVRYFDETNLRVSDVPGIRELDPGGAM